MRDLLNIDWIAALNVVLGWFSALDFGNPIVFYGTMPLWAFPVTLLLYIAVMAVKWEYETNPDLHWTMKVFGVIAGFVGLVLDFYLNVITMTIICLERPREWVVTSRLKRYHNEIQTDTRLNRWRFMVAHFICTEWLNPFDKTGTHC